MVLPFGDVSKASQLRAADPTPQKSMTDIIASIPCARPANDSPGFRVPGPRRGGLKRRGGVRTLA
jgi:hypothetical protein